MVKMSTTYVDRDEASTILKVSTRTVDRYVRKFRFKTRKDGRRVLIKRDDVNRIIENHVGQYMDIDLDNKTTEKASDITVKDIKVEAKAKEEKTESSNKSEAVYKGLYDEAKKDLKEKQERLDAATYRVGQLESQVKNMVPLLDFSRKEKELKAAITTIEQKELEKTEALNKMEHKLKSERIAKWIYLSLVGMLLVAEPILFLLWAFA